MRAGVRRESRRVEGARERLSPCRAPAARATRARASRRVVERVEKEELEGEEQEHELLAIAAARRAIDCAVKAVDSRARIALRA